MEVSDQNDEELPDCGSRGLLCHHNRSGITSQQKMELLNRVFHLMPFIPNGRSGLDIRSIHNLEKLTAYCTKQFEIVKPAYEIIDPVSSDIDINYLLKYTQDGTNWTTRHEKETTRSNQSLPIKAAKYALPIT